MRGRAVQLAVLGGLLVVLALVVLAQLRSSPAAPSSVGSQAAAQPRAGKTGSGGTSEEVAPLVKLQALTARRPEPDTSQRNPFRLQPKAPPPPPVPPALPGAGATGLAGDVPPPPPPPPPISLKFIGVVEGGGRTGRIAVLSDGRDVFYGRDGDVIDGRFRIIRVGTESIEMSYVDGRGRQTIRLTGS
jgi:hypothetical protein